jgi:hypothetical protein
MNGGIGIMRSVVAEITDTTNIAKAWGIIPISFTTGATLGALLGGALVHPAENYPGLFGSSYLMSQYPYLLACSVPAVYAIFVLWFTYIYFVEASLPEANSFPSC